MALGAVVPLEHMETLGDRKAALVTVQCTSGANYTAGGEPYNAGIAAALGWSNVESLLVDQPSAGTRLVTVDTVSKLLRVFTALGTEAVSNTDQSAFIVNALVVGF